MSGNAGKTKIAIDTASIADGDSIASYLVDSAGTLLTSTLVGGDQSLDVNVTQSVLPTGAATETTLASLLSELQSITFAEDSAHVSGNVGVMGLTVRNDAGTSLVSADGDYSPLSVDSAGNLRISGSITVNEAGDYAEDSAHVSGDIGYFNLAVRQDTLASSTSADGDYGAFKINNVGSLYVHDTDGTAQLVLANASLDAIEADADSINTAILALQKAEDAVHASGDSGIMALAVRNDAGTALAADGDYIPFSMNSSGELRVAATFNAAGDYAEDAAHVSGDVGIFSLKVRNDDQATTVTSANADYSQASVDDRGAQYVIDTAPRSNLQQIVTVGTSAVALPGTPLAKRRNMFVQMLSGGQLYLGSATVTSSGATRGLKVGEGGYINVDVGPANLVYGIANAAGKDVMVWEFA